MDVGTNSSSSDAQRFNVFCFRAGIRDGTLNIPAIETLLGDDQPMPYLLIGEDSFLFRTWLMKPQVPLGPRLLRVCRVVENFC